MSCWSEGVENKFVRYTLQAFNYTIFMTLVWYFATSPSVRVIEDDQAICFQKSAFGFNSF
jgi:hypothetical protein